MNSKACVACSLQNITASGEIPHFIGHRAMSCVASLVLAEKVHIAIVQCGMQRGTDRLSQS